VPKLTQAWPTLRQRHHLANLPMHLCRREFAIVLEDHHRKSLARLHRNADNSIDARLGNYRETKLLQDHGERNFQELGKAANGQSLVGVVTEKDRARDLQG
jgi:hypothetical protein